MSGIRIKRAYEPPAADDGARVPVDRLWPSGLKRDEAKTDFWLKDVAPRTDLRRWFAHDPARWPGSQDRHRAELAGNAALHGLLALVKQSRRVTLLSGARDTEHNNAVVLRALCERGLKP